MNMNKLCSKCRLPNEFGKDSKSKDGLKSACKICLRAQGCNYMKKRRATDRDMLNRRTEEWRLRKISENPNFQKDKYYANHSNYLDSAKKYYAKNKGSCLERQKTWRDNNVEIYQQASRNWKKMHPERTKELSRASGATHRARKRKATIVKFSIQQLEQRMSVFGFKCAYCRGKFEHIDHVIPLSKGGYHCLSNLRPACKKCNMSKSDRHLKDWLGGR